MNRLAGARVFFNAQPFSSGAHMKLPFRRTRDLARPSRPVPQEQLQMTVNNYKYGIGPAGHFIIFSGAGTVA